MTSFLNENLDSQIRNRYAEYALFDGIVKCVLKTDYMDLDIAKKLHTSRTLLQGGKKYPVLSDSRKLTEVTSEARVYGASEEVSETMLAHAVLIDKKADVFIINLFLRFNKPSIPTKFFNSEELALDWLSTFKA